MHYYKSKYEEYMEKYEIDPSVRFNGDNIKLLGEGKIIIGKNTYLGEECILHSTQGFVIRIGENVRISHYVYMYTKNYHPKYKSYVCGNIYIGNNCLIGSKAFIKHGVHIDDNTLIKANSVIKRGSTNDPLPNKST